MEQSLVDALSVLGPYGILCLTLLVLAWMGRPLIEGLVAAMKAIQKTDETLQARLAESEARWAKSDVVVTDVTNIQSQTVTQMAELTRQMNTLVKGVGDFSGRYDARATVIDGMKTAQDAHILASVQAASEIKGVLDKIDKVTAEFENLLKSRDSEVLTKLENIVNILGEIRPLLVALATPKPEPIIPPPPMPIPATTEKPA